MFQVSTEIITYVMHLFGPYCQRPLNRREGLDDDLKWIGNIFQVVYSNSGSR